jgi:hypothetical protein
VSVFEITIFAILSILRGRGIGFEESDTVTYNYARKAIKSQGENPREKFEILG